MSLKPAALLGFLLLLTQETLTKKGPALLPVRLTVENDLSIMTSESYSSYVVEEGVLLGVLKRLQETQQGFKFTVKEDPDFGPFLVSVNGVAGDETEHTYWELLSEKSGEYTRLNVGIGCYQPKADEHIILRFTKWTLNNNECS